MYIHLYVHKYYIRGNGKLPKTRRITWRSRYFWGHSWGRTLFVSIWRVVVIIYTQDHSCVKPMHLTLPYVKYTILPSAGIFEYSKGNSSIAKHMSLRYGSTYIHKYTYDFNVVLMFVCLCCSNNKYQSELWRSYRRIKKPIWKSNGAVWSVCGNCKRQGANV